MLRDLTASLSSFFPPFSRLETRARRRGAFLSQNTAASWILRRSCDTRLSFPGNGRPACNGAVVASDRKRGNELYDKLGEFSKRGTVSVGSKLAVLSRALNIKRLETGSARKWCISADRADNPHEYFSNISSGCRANYNLSIVQSLASIYENCSNY